jgi:hypothetical protein
MGDNLDGSMTTSPSVSPNEVDTQSTPTYTRAASLPSGSDVKLVEEEE